METGEGFWPYNFCVLTATGFVNREWQLLTFIQNGHPSTDHQKICQYDYVGERVRVKYNDFRPQLKE